MTEPLSEEDTAIGPATQDAGDGPRKFDPFAAQRAVLASEALSAPQRLVALALISHANRSGVCWPSVATLARETALGQRTVSRALRGLRAAGVVSWEDRRALCTSSLYTITTHDLLPERHDPPATAAGGHVPQRQEPPARAADEHLREHLSSEQPRRREGEGTPAHAATISAKNGKGSSPPSPTVDLDAKDWGVIETAYRKVRADNYGTAGVVEHVPADNRAAVLELLRETAVAVNDAWNAIHPGQCTRDHALGFVAQSLFMKWFADYEGQDDYLIRRKHPLRAFHDDLSAVLSDWLGEWEEKLEGERAKKAS